MSGSAPNPYEVITGLIDRGWIPLRQCAVLLGYNELRGIYARQKGRNAISTIRIGGVERVYIDNVIEALETCTKEDAPTYLSLLYTAKRDKEREELKDA